MVIIMIFNLLGHDIVISDETVKDAKDVLADDLANENTFCYYLELAFPNTAKEDIVNEYNDNEIAERVINVVREDMQFATSL